VKLFVHILGYDDWHHWLILILFLTLRFIIVEHWFFVKRLMIDFLIIFEDYIIIINFFFYFFIINLIMIYFYSKDLLFIMISILDVCLIFKFNWKEAVICFINLLFLNIIEIIAYFLILINHFILINSSS